MNEPTKKRRAFTLIELLIVMRLSRFWPRCSCPP
ncbi:MAG: type II secretion system protein [Verrucomicrobiota bacterium]